MFARPLPSTVTTWVENPRGGRARGPRGLARAWFEVLVRPRRFFRSGVAPGDQSSGLVFGVLVTVAYLGISFAVDPARIPSVGGGRPVSALLTLAAVGLFVAPAALHLVAALQTLLLILFVPRRAGVSETVQVLAYAVAPVVFGAVAPAVVGGVGAAALTLASGLYGTVLLAVGLGVVHETSLLRGGLAALLPAVLVFGYGFGGVAAFQSLGGVAALRSVLAALGL